MNTPDTARLTTRARLVAYLQQAGLSTARAEANIGALLDEERPTVSSSGRAALLHETADVRAQTFTSVAAHIDARAVAILRPESQTYAEWQAIAGLLRRMAAEEQPAETDDTVHTCPGRWGGPNCGCFDAPATTERPVVGEQPDTQTPDRIVAYRNPALTKLHCLRCTPHPAGDIWTPVTAAELEDGGICTVCGVDVLIPLEADRG